MFVFKFPLRQCKYDFCWICLEEWKKHSSSTGGYYRCTRYEVIQQVEEQSKEMTEEVQDQTMRRGKEPRWHFDPWLCVSLWFFYRRRRSTRASRNWIASCTTTHASRTMSTAIRWKCLTAEQITVCCGVRERLYQWKVCSRNLPARVKGAIGTRGFIGLMSPCLMYSEFKAILKTLPACFGFNCLTLCTEFQTIML